MSEYPSFDLSRPTLPENYLIAIGRVSYLWGTLETAMELAIAKFSGLEFSDPRSAVMVAHMAWPQRMDVLETFITLFVQEYKHLERFPEVKTLLKKAQEGRNRIAHAKWGYNDGKVAISKLSSRGKLKMSIDPISVTEIDLICIDIGNAVVELIKLVVDK